MFRAIGIGAVVVALGLGVAHYTGHLQLKGDAEVTEKGNALIDKSVEETQKLTNKGIDGMQGLTNKGFDALRRSKAGDKK